jgi:hypothetical protein
VGTKLSGLFYQGKEIGVNGVRLPPGEFACSRNVEYVYARFLDDHKRGQSNPLSSFKKTTLIFCSSEFYRIILIFQIKHQVEEVLFISSALSF